MGICVSKENVETMSSSSESGSQQQGQQDQDQKIVIPQKQEPQNQIPLNQSPQNTAPINIMDQNSGNFIMNSFNTNDSARDVNWDDTQLFSFMGSKFNISVTTTGLTDFDLNTVSKFSLTDDNLGGQTAQRTICGYTYVRSIGRGASSEVVQVEKGGVNYAVKICFISQNTVNFLNPETHQPKEEAAILRNFDHPHVIKIFDIIDNQTSVLIVMELLPGGTMLSLNNVEDQKMAFAESISALSYVHKQKIAHRDIKPENILLDEKGSVRLCDFGISELVPDPDTPHKYLMKGTAAYSAPEVFNSNPYNLFIADIWSMGVTLYQMAFKRLPFVGKNVFDLQKIIETTKPVYPDDADPELKDLIQGMLEKDPAKRLTIPQIWQHPWMKGMYEIVEAGISPANANSNRTLFDRKNSVSFVQKNI